MMRVLGLVIPAATENDSYVRWYTGRDCGPPSGLQAQRAQGTPALQTRGPENSGHAPRGISEGPVGGETRSVSAVRHKTAKKVSTFFAVAIVGTALLISPWSGAQSEDPAAVLQGIIDDVKTLWVPLNRDPAASYDSRRAWATTLVDTRFDLDQMARSSLGTRWRGLGAAQQEAYAPLFRQIIIETVIDWLDGYDGQQFDVTRVRQGGRNTEIQTLFVQANGRSVRLTWVTRANEGRYQFRDVRFSGISLVADFRGKYQRTLDDQGFEALVTRLQADYASLRAQH